MDRADRRSAAADPIEDWGPVRAWRLYLPSGVEVDLGLTSTAWIELPLDPGTAAVLRGGCRVVHDPEARLAVALATLDGG